MDCSKMNLKGMFRIGDSKQNDDKGIYCGEEMVGSINRMGDHWCVYRIVDTCEADDPAQVCLYEEVIRHLGDFPTLEAAVAFARGPFLDMIEEE